MLNKINSVLERHYKSKPWYKKIFLISLSTLVLFFVATLLNKIATDCEKLFAAIGSVGSVIIGFGAYQIAKKQQMNLDYKISEEEKSTIRSHFNSFLGIIYRANYFIMGGGKDKKTEADKVLYDLYVLKSEIEIYSEDLCKPISELYEIYKSIDNSHEKSAAKRDEEGVIIKKIKNLFSQYLKILNKN